MVFAKRYFSEVSTLIISALFGFATGHLTLEKSTKKNSELEYFYECNTSYIEQCLEEPPDNLGEIIEIVAKEYDLSPKAIASTVYRESACKQSALGSSGEIGLGQINPAVWVKALKKAKIIKSTKDLYDPVKNIRSTAFVLAKCKESFNNSTFEVFKCYNGSGASANKYAIEQMRAYRLTWNEEPQI